MEGHFGFDIVRTDQSLLNAHTDLSAILDFAFSPDLKTDRVVLGFADHGNHYALDALEGVEHGYETVHEGARIRSLTDGDRIVHLLRGTTLVAFGPGIRHQVVALGPRTIEKSLHNSNFTIDSTIKRLRFHDTFTPSNPMPDEEDQHLLIFQQHPYSLDSGVDAYLARTALQRSRAPGPVFAVSMASSNGELGTGMTWIPNEYAPAGPKGKHVLGALRKAVEAERATGGVLRHQFYDAQRMTR